MRKELVPHSSITQKKPRISNADFTSHVVLQKKLQAKVQRWRTRDGYTDDHQNYILAKEAYAARGREGLAARLRYMVNEDVADIDFSKSELRNLGELGDLRYPFEWFPSARGMRRQLHLHIGPTNSGKTYQALKRLEQAESGIYASPLRLLAREVYGRLNAQGKKCNLITGDEVILSEGLDAIMNSCTVEMVPIGTEMDVAVIDEIQMIADDQRGWAWTAALLGVAAKEVHLCGEERTLPLIEKLAAAMGESLTVHRYERLSPLQTSSSALRKFENLRKGDCIVAFSKREIHILKDEIEKRHRKRVAVVYGSLPPEVRAEQAKLFNDQSNDYDFLVASDAVGMGLNLCVSLQSFSSRSANCEKEYQTCDLLHNHEI